MILRNNTAFSATRTSSCSLVGARTIGLSVTIALLALLSAPRNLMAHARLVKSEPSASSAVKAPSRIRLFFSEALMSSMTRIYLVNANGDTLTHGAHRDDLNGTNAVTIETGTQLEPGTYTVKWAVAARDGHPSHGSFEFTVISPDPAAVGEARSAAPMGPSLHPQNRNSNTDRNEMMAGDNSVGMIIVRWIAFLSTFLIVGAVTFRMYLLRQPAFADGSSFVDIASTNAATLGLVASVGMLVSLILKIARESADMPDVTTRAILFASTWGWSLCCALIAALAAIVAFARVSRKATSLQGWRIAQVAAAVFVITPALSGHAIGSDRAWLTVPGDILHVAAGSIWLGTLAVIVIVGISAALKTPDEIPARARVVQLINTFSPMALTCGAIVVASGLVASVVHLPRINALWTTPYGSALYRKLIFVLLLLGIGAWNWRRTKPRLSADDTGLASLRRAATIEIVLAAAVLGLTAILVALAIPE